MAYDNDLEDRIDKLTADWDVPLVKKKMFGGIGYMLHGNMSFGVHKNQLILRATDEQSVKLLKLTGIRPFEMGGRQSKNWLFAGGEAIGNDKKLRELLETGRDYALNLPPK